MNGRLNDKISKDILKKKISIFFIINIFLLN